MEPHADRPLEPSADAATLQREAETLQREAALALLWCDVLRLQTVGRDDHFFALGGHSLQATQLMSRIQARWNLALPITRAAGVFHPELGQAATTTAAMAKP